MRFWKGGKKLLEVSKFSPLSAPLLFSPFRFRVFILPFVAGALLQFFFFPVFVQKALDWSFTTISRFHCKWLLLLLWSIWVSWLRQYQPISLASWWSIVNHHGVCPPKANKPKWRSGKTKKIQKIWTGKLYLNLYHSELQAWSWSWSTKALSA